MSEDEGESIIMKVFCEVQLNANCHRYNITFLLDYLEDVGFEKFSDEFLHTLLYIQLNAQFKTFNNYYHQISAFCSKFLKAFEGSEIKNESLAIYLLNGLVEYHNSSHDCLRFRVCETISQIFTSELPCIEQISEDLLDKIQEAMLERIRDTNLQIRLQSVITLDFLQNFEDPDDPVIAVLIDNLTSQNVKMRLAVVNIVAATPKVIPELIHRCRDVDEKIKIAAYKKFAEIPSQALTIVQRHTILRNGLKDSVIAVQNIIKEQVLPEWLKCYNYDYFKMISAILLDGNENEMQDTIKITEKVLKALFCSQTLSKILEQLKLTNKLIPSEELTWETAIYWRCLISHFRTSQEYEMYLEQILPETVHFCDYILDYYNSKTNLDLKQWEYNNFQMILLELITIAIDCDVSDECSRIQLRTLIIKILIKEDISTDVIGKIFIYLNQIMPLAEKRINFVCELISDIRNPLEPNFSEQEYADYEKKTTDLRAKINKLLDDQRTAVKEQHFQLADSLKVEIEEIKSNLTELNDLKAKEEQTARNNDPKTVLKCVNIAIELLQSLQIHKLNDALRTFSKGLLEDMVLVTVPAIQARIMTCYALCNYLDVECAKESIKLFGSALLSYRDKNPSMEECMLIVAVKSIVDLILLYGNSIFPSQEHAAELDTSDTLETLFTTTSFKEVVQIIISMMDDENPVLRETAGIGIMNIITADRVYSPMLITRLILKWFNPCTVRDAKLHQHMGVFLGKFNHNETGVKQLEEAFVPTLRGLCKAPENSPLSEVSGEKVAKFLVHLTEPTIIQNAEVHKNVAQDLCIEIESEPENIKANLLYVRTLLMLDIKTNDDEFIEALLDKCESLIDELESIGNTSLIIKNMQKLIEQLKNYSYEKDENENDGKEVLNNCTSP